ncbi:MAG: type II toxin-antitoxin system PemK/MazF family toxin [Candidatus Dormibacteraceae bacterium]
MRRGEVRWVDLAPSAGTEADKRRPAVVVSNDGANSTASRIGRGVITVVPVTSNVTRIYPFQVLLRVEDSGLGRQSKAQAEQVRSVDVSRVGSRVSQLPAGVMEQVDEALRIHLAL